MELLLEIEIPYIRLKRYTWKNLSTVDIVSKSISKSMFCWKIEKVKRQTMYMNIGSEYSQ